MQQSLGSLRNLNDKGRKDSTPSVYFPMAAFCKPIEGEGCEGEGYEVEGKGEGEGRTFVRSFSRVQSATQIQL